MITAEIMADTVDKIMQRFETMFVEKCSYGEKQAIAKFKADKKLQVCRLALGRISNNSCAENIKTAIEAEAFCRLMDQD